MKLYVASSWRNSIQPRIVRFLRIHGHVVYDFREPEAGDRGFHWSEIDCDWQAWNCHAFCLGLKHDLARAGFRKDFDAMQDSEACVLVLPCGRSAHLEAGWFWGQGRPVVIFMHGGIEPELMYSAAAAIVDSFEMLKSELALIECVRIEACTPAEPGQ